MIISSVLLLLSCSLVMLGGGLLAVGYYMNEPGPSEMKQAAGRVVDVVARRDAYQSEQVLFHPLVEFTTESGATLRFESKFATRPPSQKVGDSVNVYYDPANPENGEIQPPALRKTGMALVGVIGTVVLVVGCLCIAASGLLMFTGL